MFEKLKILWESNYITLESLKKWVQLNEKNSSLGITREEFELITQQQYK